nr:retrovirus-related Pol polyprotein from transposon TNT 1-94 [Tanacetum cinerariifolium]
NPRLSITQVQLKGDNYDEWSRYFRTALRARKKLGFVDGTIKQPQETNKDVEDWWTINYLLVSWIRNTIEPSLRFTISHVEIAKILWDDLKDRFSITNGPQIQQMKSDLASCQQRVWWGETPRVDIKVRIYEKAITTRRGKGKGSHGSTRANTVQAGGGIGADTGTSDSNVIPLPGLNSKK